MKQRIWVLAASILAGMVLLEGVRLVFLENAPAGSGWFITLLIALGAAGLGALYEARLSIPPTRTTGLPDSRPDPAEELPRLNAELKLQTEMYARAEETARLSEERFRNMADNIQEGLTIFENGSLVYLNERACEIFGDCPDGDLHSRLMGFAAPEEVARLRAVLQDAGQTERFPDELEFWIQRKDGARRCVRERYTTSREDGVERIFIVSSDVTTARQALLNLEHAVSDRTHELSTVLDISRRIASTLDLEPLLNLVLEQIGTIIPYSGAAIFTLEDDRLYLAASQTPHLHSQSGPVYLSLERAGPYRQVIAEKQVQIVEDVKGDTPLLRALQESGGSSPAFIFDHARSWIGIPLVIREQATGLLSLTHHESNYYTQQHARLAMTAANQVAIAIENARLYEQAQNLGVIEERHRIARELHDSATQLLYGICLYCTATARKLRSGNISTLEADLAEIKDNALQALQEMRLLILELDPPLLQKAGLADALRCSLESISTRTGLVTELEVAGLERLPRPLESELYRIAIEALNNLVRYARAKHVTVELRADDARVWLIIFDNGVGFDLAAARSSGGMGLHNMEQRARQIQGKLDIRSAPGEGTRICVEAPVFNNRHA